MRALLTLVAAGVLAVPAAWGVHTFADVPTASPHHADVTAIFNARITTGCAPGPPPLYCPADPVRRDQMGSFLRRGLGRVGAAGTTAGLPLTSTFQDLASTNITSGGTTGGTGFVLLIGSFSLFRFDFDDQDVRIEFRFIEAQTGFTSNLSSVTLRVRGGAFQSAAPAKQWVFSIPTGTTRTYRLQARIVFGPGTANVAAESRLITAVYLPFGSTGGSTLGGSPGTADVPERAGDG